MATANSSFAANGCVRHSPADSCLGRTMGAVLKAAVAWAVVVARAGAAEGEGAPRGVSLAFVFDSTGSMHDELNQVKVGASKILRALRDHPDAPIANYIWVPFSDPGVGPVTTTRDDREFQERVNEVEVFGGGDCPEMSLGAIKKALEASLPHSYIYVFTDASAKDHRLQNEVVSLVQRKKCQVVFILTGDCMDLEEPNYKAYERIAESSSGQIYRLSRSEVKQVLEYVNVAIQPHVVSLLSLNRPAPEGTAPDKLEVLIDESLSQFTVSVSGTNATLNVSDPKGLDVRGPPKLHNVLNLTNIKVVNVNRPDPGPWSVFINSDSNYTVRSTGLSKIDFNHGFSTVPALDINHTNYRPLEGASSFLLIQTSDVEKVFNVTEVDLVSVGGEVLQRVQVKAVGEVAGLYGGGSFVPPSEMFYVGVRGFGQDGLPVRRISSTAVSAQVPEKPVVRVRVVGGGGGGGRTVRCHVESAVPFSVRWYREGRPVGEESRCSETCEVVLGVEGGLEGGRYSCSARSAAGSESGSVEVSGIGESPVVVAESPVVVSSGERAYLNCLVESKVAHVVKWWQLTARDKQSGVLHAVSTGVKLPNNTLMIESARAEDEGWYVCSAVSGGGESRGRVLLVVKEPLVVTVEPRSASFAEGESARLSCSASGKPRPRLEWGRDQQVLTTTADPSVFLEEVNGKLNLVIDYLEKNHSGVYFCNAVNDDGSATATAELIYTERPRVKAAENNLLVKAGSRLLLRCSATGEPPPAITWYKGDVPVRDAQGIETTRTTLTIHSAHSSDGGDYACVARNALGSDTDYIGVIVGSPPTFLHQSKENKIHIGHDGTLPCSALGVPSPEVKWTRTDGRTIDGERLQLLPGGGLRVARTRLEDGGQYLCTAENAFGSARREVTLTVTGIEKPAEDSGVEQSSVEGVVGGELAVACGVSLGRPPGEVKWLKEGVEVLGDGRRRVEESGRLVIANATAEDGGSYVCRVENRAGNWSRGHEVVIAERPRIKDDEEGGLKGRLGGEIVIPCPVEGFPTPTVTWTKNGQPLPLSSTIFQDEQGSLIIRNLSEDSAGVYVCTAANAVGSASKATSIHVQVPPVFPEDVRDFAVSVVEGHVVVLDCNVAAVPEPTVRWLKNEEPLLQSSDQPKTLRFVATTDDTALFKCVADNEAGSSSKEFNVTILVPPRIVGRSGEESLRVRAGEAITLECDVAGVPRPTILWQRNGMYLTQNTSEVVISGEGSLTIGNVTKESAGAYTCDAENLAGIAQRTYYLQVNFPPRIITANSSRVITLNEGDDFSLPCVAEGSPKPTVTWTKNGLPITPSPSHLLLHDSTLLLLHVSPRTTGLYRCDATNAEGSDHSHHRLAVLGPAPDPLTRTRPRTRTRPTTLDVNEGDSLSLTCPDTAPPTPTSHMQWFKDGQPLAPLQERSDEAQRKLSPDLRTLTIIEAHPSDGGEYSCVATHPSGRTDASFLVDVLMTPHFEEFNHVAHRTILTGGEVVLNCSVSGNPRPKVTWRKGEVAITTPQNGAGAQVSADGQHLVVASGRAEDAGTYTCVASNRVSTKEREFYVTVLEPPQVTGRLKEVVEVVQGEEVTLLCEGSGLPAPTVSWWKQEEPKKPLGSGGKFLTIGKASCDDGGTYFCEMTNAAGSRRKQFQLNVYGKPQTDGGDAPARCTDRDTPTAESKLLLT